jgi:hypothetical protein
MANILFTAITARVAKNWTPALRLLASRGHNVQSVLFPHAPDPDSLNLAALGFDNIASLPISTHLSGFGDHQSKQLAKEAEIAIRCYKPTLVILTSCHAGPETRLMEILANNPMRPTVVGCQHGFVQNWSGYWSHFCMDRLFIFGRHFLPQVPASHRDDIVVAGLPKLDSIRPVDRAEFAGDHRPILFAAQTACTPRLIATLRKLSEVAGRTVVIRPHPEARNALDDLRGLFDFWNYQTSLEEQFSEVSMVLTTGSTVALEAIAAQVPVVVLPEQRGDEYESAGVVARNMDALEIIGIASEQSTPSCRARLLEFLEAATGSRRPDRAASAADHFESLL